MIVKRLHAKTKIFFPSPYMVRVEFPHEMSMETALLEYRKTVRKAYKLLTGTWGYCQLETEQVKIKDEFKHLTPPGVGHFGGMTPGVIISSLFDPDYQYRIRGYICFSDELDALQFRLTINTNAIRVMMWPERWFVIHEMVDVDES